MRLVHFNGGFRTLSNSQDEVLLEAELQARQEIDSIIDKIKKKRWEYVARSLQKKLKKSIQYSPGSCQKRYVSLMNETARIPIELDDNPEQRLVDRHNRSIQVLQCMREAEAAEFEMKNKKKLEKDEKELKVKVKREERAKKRSEKAKANLQKAEEKANKAKAKFDAELKKREAEKARIEQIQKDIAAGISTRPDGLTSAQKRKVSQDTSNISTRTVSSGLPRSRMSLLELIGLCLERKLPKTGSKAQLQHRLEKEAKAATPEVLRKRLEEYNVSIEGGQEDLVTLLAQADEANSTWGRNYDPSGYIRPRKRQRTMLSKPTDNESDGEESFSMVCECKVAIKLKEFRIVMELTMQLEGRRRDFRIEEQQQRHLASICVHVQVFCG